MTEQVRRLLAELLGSFFLLLIGGLAILAAGGLRPADGARLDAAGLVVVAFGFGFALLASLYAFGEISGGHFNPAVSLGAALDGRIEAATLVQYVVAQVAGAVLAGLALLWASSQAAVASTATVPAQGVGAGSAFLLELLLTAVFVAVILMVVQSERVGTSAFLGIPLTYVGVHLAAASSSGASLNPARTLGSAIIGNEYGHVWVYLTAPLLGAVLGWLLHQFVSGRTRAGS